MSRSSSSDSWLSILLAPVHGNFRTRMLCELGLGCAVGARDPHKLSLAVNGTVLRGHEEDLWNVARIGVRWQGSDTVLNPKKVSTWHRKSPMVEST